MLSTAPHNARPHHESVAKKPRPNSSAPAWVSTTAQTDPNGLSAMSVPSTPVLLASAGGTVTTGQGSSSSCVPFNPFVSMMPHPMMDQSQMFMLYHGIPHPSMFADPRHFCGAFGSVLPQQAAHPPLMAAPSGLFVMPTIRAV